MMDTKKKALVTVVIGGSLFIGWRGYLLVDRILPAQASAAVTPSEEVSSPAPDALRSAAKEDMTAIWDAQHAVEAQPWGRNPFDASPFEATRDVAPTTPIAKSAAKPTAGPQLTLSGVSKSGDRWLAAVDGAIVGIGDMIQEKYKVVRISTSSITLASDGWAFHYELGAKGADIRPWTEKP